MNAIYCRVSTDAQAEQGYSIADQIRSCHAHATKLGLVTTAESEYIDDGYSGEYLDRPALDRLRDALQDKRVKNVIIYDPDRLSRNLTNQLLVADEIEKAGAKLYFVTGDYDASPEGRLFFSIRGAISAFEKAKIRERTLRGKRSKALSGKLVFNDDIYGYVYDEEKSMYTINQQEAEIVKLIFNLYTSRNYGVNSLYSELKAMGIVNRKGKPFHASTLSSMLSNETYSGTKWSFTIYNKSIGQKKRKRTLRDESEWIPISVPAIVDKEIWDKAAECRRLNKVSAKRNTKTNYLLSGIIRCSACGYAMHGVNYRRGNKEYPYYVCTAYVNNNKCQNRKCIPSVELDEAIWSDITNTAKNNHNLSIYHDNVKKNMSTARNNLEKQLEELQTRKATLIKWVADGMIEIKMAERDLQNINREIASTQSAINAVTMPASTSKIITMDDIMAAETFEDKHRLMLQSGITVHAQRDNGKTLYTIKA